MQLSRCVCPNCSALVQFLQPHWCETFQMHSSQSARTNLHFQRYGLTRLHLQCTCRHNQAWEWSQCNCWHYTSMQFTLCCFRRECRFFIAPAHLKYRPKRSYRLFETRFDALVSKCPCRRDDLYLADSLIALQMLKAANADDSQRVPILPACASKVSLVAKQVPRSINQYLSRISLIEQ